VPQWKGRALDEALQAATNLMDQLNFFLIAHLKSVPLEKLGQKIKETFLRIDLDNSGELTQAEVGAAFERLGKPLSKTDLDVYMQTVDVDGNGVVDVYEFEHMTRRLLDVDCKPSCSSCRHLNKAGKDDNWGANKSEALEDLENERIALEKIETPNMFTRVGSAPGTAMENDQAEADAMKRRAQKIKREQKKKEANYQRAISSPTISSPTSKSPAISSPMSKLKTKKTSSVSPLARPDSLLSRANGSPSSAKQRSPHASISPHTATSTISPSRVTSKLHDAIAMSSPDQGRAM
jgi:hypothetical protein